MRNLDLGEKVEDFTFADNGAIEYNGIRIAGNGLISLGTSESGEVMRREPTSEEIETILNAVQSGDLILSNEQRENLDMIIDPSTRVDIKSVIEEQMQEPELLNQSNYLKYQEDVLNQTDLAETQTDFKLVFVTEFRYDHERHPKSLYFKSGEKYMKAILPVAEDGSVSLQDIQEVTDISEIVTEIEDYKSESGIIGNAYEYIELLKMQGRDEEAEIILKKQEYFESQKDKIFELENQSKKNEKMMDDMFSSFYNDVLNPDDLSHSINDYLEEEFASFTYNGVNYTVDSNGFCQQVGQTGNVILGNISKKTLDEIKRAVENGELILTEEQKKSLNMIIQDDDVKENILIESGIEATEQSTTTGNIIAQKKAIIQEQTNEHDKSKQDDITPQQ